MGHTILIIDDSRTVRGIIGNLLKQGRAFQTVLEAADGAEGLKVAAEHPVDVVLCDLDMPEVDGFEFLRKFRSDEKNLRIPVLMLSGTDTPKKKVEGFALGANDYIIKPCDPDELRARVKNYLHLKQLQDELERTNFELAAKNDELLHASITDPLTGLFNRRHFLERIEEELKRSRRHKHAFGVLMMDIDHFKRINDQKGHAMGDAALIEVAGALKATLRETDLLARFGGEEFLACVPETPDMGSQVVAERLRAAVERLQVPGLGWSVTISVGLSVYPATSIDTVDKMVSAADEALYRAKGAGRNRVELAR